MNKKILRLLGSLSELHRTLWNDLCRVLPLHGEGSPSANDLAAKLRLLDELAWQIEEHARGFKKSKLPWHSAGAFFVRSHFLPYAEIHKGVTAILMGAEPESDNSQTDTKSVLPPPSSLMP